MDGCAGDGNAADSGRGQLHEKIHAFPCRIVFEILPEELDAAEAVGGSHFQLLWERVYAWLPERHGCYGRLEQWNLHGDFWWSGYLVCGSTRCIMGSLLGLLGPCQMLEMSCSEMRQDSEINGSNTEAKHRREEGETSVGADEI